MARTPPFAARLSLNSANSRRSPRFSTADVHATAGVDPPPTFDAEYRDGASYPISDLHSHGVTNSRYTFPHVTYLPLRALRDQRVSEVNEWAMPTEDGRANRQSAISAAVRRFPQFELAIHRLMDRNESFRDMCEELAEAELALFRVDQVAPAVREGRRAEWQEMVERLVREVEAALIAEA